MSNIKKDFLEILSEQEINLQETLEDTLWEQNTQISGGRWIDKNGIVEVDR